MGSYCGWASAALTLCLLASSCLLTVLAVLLHPHPRPQICSATLTVTGGNILGLGPLAAPAAPAAPTAGWSCPAGTYYDVNLICPIW